MFLSICYDIVSKIKSKWPHHQISEKEPTGSEAPSPAIPRAAEDNKPVIEEKPHTPENQQDTDEHQAEAQDDDTHKEVKVTDKVTSPESCGEKPVEDSRSPPSDPLGTEANEESPESPVEKTTVEQQSKQAEESSHYHVERKTEEEASTAQAEEKDQDKDKVFDQPDTTEPEQTKPQQDVLRSPDPQDPTKNVDEDETDNAADSIQVESQSEDLKPEEIFSTEGQTTKTHQETHKSSSPALHDQEKEAEGQHTSQTADSSAPADGDVTAEGTVLSQRPETSQEKHEKSPSDKEDSEKEVEKEDNLT
ncbi:protein starmaker-like [Echeneis naucrates]|uniref:protein starmaker-like n=1 Tax=Echeneis naucrates TaxID=173247 RepID=UPI0011143296|nr:protein starmaker-like [Echeneis naucrates]